MLLLSTLSHFMPILIGTCANTYISNTYVPFYTYALTYYQLLFVYVLGIRCNMSEIKGSTNMCLQNLFVVFSSNDLIFLYFVVKVVVDNTSFIWLWVCWHFTEDERISLHFQLVGMLASCIFALNNCFAKRYVKMSYLTLNCCFSYLCVQYLH